MGSLGAHSWRICVFDAFRLEKDGEVVAFLQNRRQDEILALLALDAARPQKRVEIAAALWPEKPDALRYNRLTEVLVHCRRLLAEVGLPDDAILRGRGVIQLNPAIDTDLKDFNRLLDAAKHEEKASAKKRIHAQLRAMYGIGPLPLFSGEAFEEARERLNKRYAEALQRTEVLAGALDGGAQEYYAPAPDESRSREHEGAEAPSLDPEEGRSPEILGFVKEAAVHLWGADRSQWVVRVEERYHEIMEYVEAALNRGDSRAAAELLSELWPIWLERPGEDRGRLLLERTLLEFPISNTALSGRLLHGAGVLALRTGDLDIATNRLERARSIWEVQNNRLWYARAVNSLGIIQYKRNQFELARKLHAESLYLLRTMDQPEFLMKVLKSAASVETATGNYSRAKPLLIEAIAIARTLENDAALGRTLIELSSLFMRQEDWEHARKAADEGLSAHKDIDDPFQKAVGLRVTAFLMHQDGDLEEAAKRYEECERLFRESNDLREVGETLIYLADVYSEMGRRDDAIASCASGGELARAVRDVNLVEMARTTLSKIKAQQPDASE
jgi:tetratricopeptide (TPR) repeat protein